MNLVICIHNTYSNVHCALASGSQILERSSIAKEFASAQLINSINTLLHTQKYQLSDITRIIVNQGPAPFTTLRTTIVTVNGIAFAHKTPLIGVDALDAFMSEYSDKNSTPTVVLLNAFNKAVYYSFIDPVQQQPVKGYAQLESCITMIRAVYKNTHLTFLGNGTQLYRDEIKFAFGSHAHIPDPLPLTASLQQILNSGIDQLKHNPEPSYFIEPLYLKKSLS